ncbi:hypothetical protein ACFL6S_18015 [Candidatus Poribacteria bacterium]
MLRQRNLADYPTLSTSQAAALFLWSPRTFRDRFERVLQYEIRHVKTDRGMRLLLEDVLRAAYPDAQDDTIYQLAFSYTMRDAIRRKKTFGKRKDRAEKEGIPDET